MLVVLGGSGRVGRRLRHCAAQPGAPQVQFLSRSGADLPPWGPDLPLPVAAGYLLLSGVTRGSPQALAQNSRLAREAAVAVQRAGAGLLLFASSQAVYGAALRSPGGATEREAARPFLAYGAAKLAAEAVLCEAYAAAPERLVRLRLGNVIGADELGAAVAAGADLRLDRFADGSYPTRSSLSPACLLRLAQGLTFRAARGERLPPLLNAAAAVPVSMADLLRHAGLPFTPRPAPPEAQARLAMNCGLLAARFPDLLPEQELEALVRALLQGRER